MVVVVVVVVVGQTVGSISSPLNEAHRGAWQTEQVRLNVRKAVAYIHSTLKCTYAVHFTKCSM